MNELDKVTYDSLTATTFNAVGVCLGDALFGSAEL